MTATEQEAQPDAFAAFLAERGYHPEDPAAEMMRAAFDAGVTSAQEPARKVRLRDARQTLQNARNYVGQKYEYGDISQGQHGRFMRIIDGLEPVVTEPQGMTEEYVAAWEAAVTALRAKAISLCYDDGEFCSGGLNGFLDACGLDRPTNAEKSG